MNPDNQILLISILVLVLISALGVNYYFHKREEAEYKRRIKTRQLKAQIEQTLDVLTVLKRTVCDPRLISTLTDHSVSLIGQLGRLNPGSDITEQFQGNVAVENPAQLVLNTAAGIEQAQKTIRQGTQILLQLKQSGRLTPLLFSEFNRELNWIHCLVEADAHLEHGKKLLENNKHSVAIAHFKQAKTALTRLGGKDPRKEQKLEQVRNTINEAEKAKQAPKGEAAKS